MRELPPSPTGPAAPEPSGTASVDPRVQEARQLRRLLLTLWSIALVLTSTGVGLLVSMPGLAARAATSTRIQHAPTEPALVLSEHVTVYEGRGTTYESQLLVLPRTGQLQGTLVTFHDRAPKGLVGKTIAVRVDPRDPTRGELPGVPRTRRASLVVRALVATATLLLAATVLVAAVVQPGVVRRRRALGLPTGLGRSGRDVDAATRAEMHATFPAWTRLRGRPVAGVLLVGSLVVFTGAFAVSLANQEPSAHVSMR